MKFRDCELQTWVWDKEFKIAGRIVFLNPSTEQITLTGSIDGPVDPLGCWRRFALALRKLSPLELLALQAT